MSKLPEERRHGHLDVLRPDAEAIASLDEIGLMPGAGSPRVGELCDIPGLRNRRVTGFPLPPG